MAEVKVSGTWLHSLGNVSAVKWSSVWGPSGACGSSLASCDLAVDPSSSLRFLRLNQPLEIWSDGVKVFSGVVTEPGSGFPRSISAAGWATRGDDFDAVDSTGNPTTNPRTAVTQAITNGLPWTNPTVFANASIGVDGEATTQRISDLLTTWATTTGQRWGVDDERRAFVATDPTTPTWFLDAADLPLGVASDGLYTRVRARYFSATGTDGNPSTPLTVTANDAAGQAEFGVIEYPMDLTGLGVITSTVAQGYANQQLILLTVPQWLSRITTDSGRLLTKGGLPAVLSSVRAGQMLRLFNVPSTLGGLRSELGVDVVLGEVEYDTENPTQITLAPVGLAVRSIADLATQAKQAADKLAAAAAA